MPTRLIAAVFLTLLVVACDDDSPTAPSGPSSMTFGAIAPAAGGSVTTTGQLPGAMIVRGSGQVSIPITVSVRRELPWAQLSVYLMTADGTYCGQNMPDAPTWGPYRANSTATVTITGFQVFRLPCAVTGVKAYLHTRNNGLLIPPTESETAAEGSTTASFTIR